jgi:hypothetical protein
MNNNQPSVNPYKVGDTVITKKFDSTMEYSRPIWLPLLFPFVGKSGEVEEVKDKKIKVHGWMWPLEAVELVSGKTTEQVDGGYSEPEKALALMAVIEMFGDEFVSAEPEATANLMDLYLKGYYAAKP